MKKALNINVSACPIFLPLILLNLCSCCHFKDKGPYPTTNRERLHILATEPQFWSRIGFAQDPTRLDEKGNPKFYDSSFNAHSNTCNAFEEAGVKLFTSILHNGWVGVDKYNYAATDLTLDTILKDHPKRLYLPRIKLNVPIEWALANPEELYASYKAPRDKEGILRLAKKMTKYWATSGWSWSGVPDDEGRIGLQSFSSEKWKQDAGVALAKLIDHLENGPYADRIVGYQVAFGACGETAYWGAFNRKLELKGDFGIGHRCAFYDWCINKYGSLEALRKAWNKPDLAFANFTVPTPQQLTSDNTTLESFFHKGPSGQKCIDYNIFFSKVNATAIEHFGRVVKKETGGKPVGVFYGYLFTQSNARVGHLAIDQLLDSPYVDFLCSPKQYYRCAPGWPGGEQTPSLSIGRKKLWIDELDNPTHLNKKDKRGPAKTMDETRTVLWREVAKNLAYNNQSFWWMDLHGGDFDDPEIMAEIAKLEKVNRSVRARPRKSVSDVLYVVDDWSFASMRDSHGVLNGNSGGFFCETESELKLTGTPVDTYRLCDLEDLPLSQYKLIVFGNAFRFEEGQWERVKKRLPETATIVWNYAAAIRKPDFAWEHVKEVTGFAVEPCPASAAKGVDGYTLVNDFPLIRIKPLEDQSVLWKYPDGGIMTASKKNDGGGRTILCAYPSLTAAKLRGIAEEAGCHMYAPLNCTVYADTRFVGVFSKEDIKGKLNLKKPSKLKELISGKEYTKGSEVPLNLPAKRAAFYLMD